MAKIKVFKVNPDLRYEELAEALLDTVSNGDVFALDLEGIDFPISRELELVFRDIARYWPQEWGEIWKTITFTETGFHLTKYGVQIAINEQRSAEHSRPSKIATEQEREAFRDRYRNVLVR